ncbi:hypothetical protein ATCC90586_005864 [Pythium insidiosum]|nr:hypothetical protein ATCC90586_005864 [Pythium insidiosum]
MARRLLARSLSSHATKSAAQLQRATTRAAVACFPQPSHRRCLQTTALRCASDSERGASAKPPVDTESDKEQASEEDEEEEEEEYEEEDWEDDEGDSDEDDAPVDAADEGAAMAAQYLGVKYSPSKVKKYSAELELDGHIIVGGDYWTALDAAKGYDELVDLYCDLETPRNFPAGSEEAEAAAGLAVDGPSEWEVPDAGKRNADIIPPIPQTYLTLDEVLAALEREKAIDVYTVDLAGKSSLADFMVFTTGRSQAHMRRMADMLIQSMKARSLADDFDYGVEGRDCDDWMIADCNNIVVHFMREDTRRILNLEQHWEQMENDKHRVYGDMTEDEYMDKFGTSELMEYLEDDDFERAEGADDADDDARGKRGDDIDWK